MGSILHVLTDPGVNEAVRRAAVLFAPLTGLGWASHVAVLRGPLDQAPKLPSEFPVHELGRPRAIDPRPWLSLRAVIRAIEPASVHAWGLRAMRLAVSLASGRLVVGNVLDDGPPSWLDRLLLRRLGAPRIASIAPAVVAAHVVDRGAALRDLDLPPDARIIVCSGLVERGGGFMEAVWVFDILKYVYRDLWLLVVGDGSQRARVEEFARSLGRTDYRVRFAGARPDGASLLGLAEVVWVLGERGGRYGVVEAIAAGRPVVARQRPDLAELLGASETGILVPRADRHEVARATRRILDDSVLRARLEIAACERAAQFTPERIAPKWAELYERLCCAS